MSDVTSNTQPVCYVSPCCFTRPHNSDNLSSVHAIISSHRIAVLYSRELSLSDCIPAAPQSLAAVDS